MRIYNLLITSDDFRKVRHEEIVTEKTIKQRLVELVPECNVDLEKIFTDKRCFYFEHYMPANVTTTQLSYKEENTLFKSGNQVKVYISQIWHP